VLLRRRRSNPLIWLVIGAALLATASGLVGSRFASPAQQAANAAAPPFTPITAPVVYDVLQATVAFRADVVDAAPIPAYVPDDLNGALPVVTRLNEAQGEEVDEGSWLMAVAERPIIVLVGTIPAFRDMIPGEDGVDIAQLQSALHRLGFATGADASGVYGHGTEEAVRAWYGSLGFDPGLGPQGATVPRGEVVYVPRLPERVVALNVVLGGTAPSSGPLALIGSGTIVLTGAVDAGTVTGLRAGQSATAHSDLSNESLSATVQSVSTQPMSNAATGTQTYAVTLSPASTVAPDLIGQDVGVTVATATSEVRTWIVPITAVTTTADGRSSVTVVGPRGKHVEVDVVPGLVAGGRQSVTPVSAVLRVGERVVIGIKRS
jgi:peptidoglycan hydrolase-like protein with peptidoglycan-binding domain